MKTTYVIAFCLLVLSVVPGVHARDAKLPRIDLPSLKELPEGKYTVTLELKQLDGKPACLTLESSKGSITGVQRPVWRNPRARATHR